MEGIKIKELTYFCSLHCKDHFNGAPEIILFSTMMKKKKLQFLYKILFEDLFLDIERKKKFNYWYNLRKKIIENVKKQSYLTILNDNRNISLKKINTNEFERRLHNNIYIEDEMFKDFIICLVKYSNEIDNYKYWSTKSNFKSKKKKSRLKKLQELQELNFPEVKKSPNYDDIIKELQNSIDVFDIEVKIYQLFKKINEKFNKYEWKITDNNIIPIINTNGKYKNAIEYGNRGNRKRIDRAINYKNINKDDKIKYKADLIRIILKTPIYTDKLWKYSDILIDTIFFTNSQINTLSTPTESNCNEKKEDDINEYSKQLDFWKNHALIYNDEDTFIKKNDMGTTYTKNDFFINNCSKKIGLNIDEYYYKYLKYKAKYLKLKFDNFN